MAVNPNNQLKAEHTCYTATTGGGKSVAVMFSGRVPKSPRLAIFDPYNEYRYQKGNDSQPGFARSPVYHYETRAQFSRAFANAWRSGRSFKVAYSPKKPSREEMLWFCDLMWAASDGNRRLDVVIEELAKWTPSSGKEPSNSRLGECLTGGRKFGIVMHTVFQTPTEVPKTITKQTPFKIVGIQDDRAEAERMARECDVDWKEIASLTPLTYLFKKPGVGNVSKLDLRHVFK